VNKERLELENNPVFEQAELATMLRARGVSAATARQAAAEISAHPDKALGVHVLEELGVDPGELPSPVVAAGASLPRSRSARSSRSSRTWRPASDGPLARARRRRRDRRRGMVARLTDRPFWRGRSGSWS